MNKIFNKFWLNRDMFMLEFYLRQPGFTNVHLLNIIKELKNSEKLVIKSISIQTN